MIVYLVVGSVAYWPLLPGTSHRLFGAAPDSVQAMWYLAWLPHSLSAGLNPFFSHAMLEPAGINLAQNTEAPLLGLMTAPLSLFMGPIGSANLLMVLAMPVSAMAGFVVLRKWKVWRPAAALGGLAYGFCAYSVGHGLGHLQFIFLPIPPFIAMTVVSILRQERGPLRLGCQLGLLVAAQFLIEPEIMSSVMILAAWGVLCAAIRYRSRIGVTARSAAKAFGIAVAVSVAVLAYPAWMILAGPGHYTTVLESHYNDLFSFVDPGPLQRISLGLHFPNVHVGDPSEAGAYVGIPILVASAIFIWRSRHSPRMQLATATLFGAAVLSLGPHLVIDGASTHVPLPFLLFSHLPILRNQVATRYSFEVGACFAAILAFGVDDVRRSWRASHRHSSPVSITAGAAVCIVVLAALVLTQLPRWPYASQSVQHLPPQVRSAIPAGDPLAITYPYAIWPLVEPMVWQADDGFAFRLVGGYALHPDARGHTTINPDPLDPPALSVFFERIEAFDPFLRAFNPPLAPQAITPDLVGATKAALRRNRVRVVIVDRFEPDAPLVADLFSRAIGPPTVSTRGFLLWVGPSITTASDGKTQISTTTVGSRRVAASG